MWFGENYYLLEYKYNYLKQIEWCIIIIKLNEIIADKLYQILH